MTPFATEHAVTLRSQIDGSPIDVEADGQALQQVLTNLIDNTLKHAPQGSEIKVGLEFPEKEGT